MTASFLIDGLLGWPQGTACASRRRRTESISEGSASGSTIGTAPADRNIISKTALECSSTHWLRVTPSKETTSAPKRMVTPQHRPAVRNTYGILLVGLTNTIQNNLISKQQTPLASLSAGRRRTITVTNNLIGTKADGTSAMHNGTGVEMMFGATDATVDEQHDRVQ